MMSNLMPILYQLIHVIYIYIYIYIYINSLKSVIFNFKFDNISQ